MAYLQGCFNKYLGIAFIIKNELQVHNINRIKHIYTEIMQEYIYIVNTTKKA